MFTDAVRRSAGSVIFIHNHPSGDPKPSEADIETTRRLIEAGNILGIPVDVYKRQYIYCGRKSAEAG